MTWVIPLKFKGEGFSLKMARIVPGNISGACKIKTERV
jgi:hypothetical protein